MKLYDLFNENDQDLAPGEKRAIMLKIKDLNKIKDKITNNEIFLNSLSYTNSPGSRSLAAKFQELKDEVQNKINDLRTQLKTEKENALKNDPEVEELLKKIESECSDYVAVVRKTRKILYRGSKNAPEAYVGKSWDQRRTKDSNQRSQHVYDSVLKLLGFKANRGNSIFCSPRMSQASGYGTVYYIFPKNGFSFLYTNDDDLIMDSDFMRKFLDQDKCSEYITRFKNWFTSAHPDAKTSTSYPINEISRLLDTFERDQSWFNPTRAFNQIDSIISDPFYRIADIPDDLKLTPDLYAKCIDLEKFKSSIQPKDDDLAFFLESRTGEICVSGTFYALSIERFEDIVPERFGFDKSSTLFI